MSMIDMFLKGVGFDPAEFAQACEYYKKEFDGMKTGLTQAMRHFNAELAEVRKDVATLNAKLSAVETQFSAVETKLDRLLEMFPQRNAPIATRYHGKDLTNENGRSNDVGHG